MSTTPEGNEKGICIKGGNMGVDRLRARAANPQTVRVIGNYTSPKSYGVYRLGSQGNVGRRYRFGNYPVRMNELLRDYGNCHLEAIFLNREDARSLADYLNSK